jgi:hypothetical protein
MMPNASAGGLPQEKERLTASEVGRYTYCARAWWLQRVKGWAPSNRAALIRDTRRHDEHIDLTRQANRARWWVRYLVLAVLLLAASLALSYLVLGR